MEGKANGNLYPLRKSPSVRMSIEPQCTVTVWQCWRNEAQLAKHVKELVASLVVINLQKQLFTVFFRKWITLCLRVL